MAEEKKHVTVGIATQGIVSAEFFKHFIPFFGNLVASYRANVVTIDGPSSDIARNALATAVMQNKSDYLLLLDPDTVFPANLTELLMKSDSPIVSALTFTKKRVRPTFLLKDGKKYKALTLEDVDQIVKEKPGQLLEVGALNLDCCLIKREVLEKVSEDNKDKPLFQNLYKSKDDLTTEEIYFSELVKKAGFKLHVDTSTIVGKIGSISPEAIFRPRPAQK